MDTVLETLKNWLEQASDVIKTSIDSLGALAKSEEASGFLDYWISWLKALFLAIQSWVMTRYDPLPIWLKVPIIIVIVSAAVGATFACVLAHIRFNVLNAGICYREDVAKGETLLRNYFYGPGLHHISNIRSEIKKINSGHRNWFGLAFLQKALGDFEPESKALLVPLAPVFLALWAMSVPEVLIRGLFWRILRLALTLAHFAIIVVGSPIARILAFILKTEQSMEVANLTFACPKCKRRSSQPYYVCEKCVNVHQVLEPGRYGLFGAQCGFSDCGKKLPVYMRDKKHLLKSCPYCRELLDTGSSHNFGIQLVGGSSSGKTAFLAAFWHLYFQGAGNLKTQLWVPLKDRFDELEESYEIGLPKLTLDTNSIAYSVEHPGNVNLTLYDISGSAFEFESYSVIQEQFGYCDSAVIVIDPLSSPNARDKYNSPYHEDLQGFSNASPSFVISAFINEYRKQKGLRTDQAITIPVAVAITKTDVEAVRGEIGIASIQASYSLNSKRFKSFEDARNSICRDYLTSIDMGDVVNQLEFNFKNLRYYPVSAIGHNAGSEFEPSGVAEAMESLLKPQFAKILKEGSYGRVSRERTRERAR
ncbi:MAG: hypothetical protein LBT59_06335 [Clostridiales bacterium]|nr:hypothetical protein [Clostridiales bacterium]